MSLAWNRGGSSASGDFAFLDRIALYLVNNVMYSAILKDVAILDAISIAFGFVLRLLAGIYVLGILPTAWIVFCTFFLALFLGLSKRRAELAGMQNSGKDAGGVQRPILEKYSIAYLDSLINSAATMTIMCYALFTVASGKNPTLIVTLPIVYYAVMHYKRRVMMARNYGEEPDRLVLTDLRIPACIAMWLVLYLAVEYSGVRLLR